MRWITPKVAVGNNVIYQGCYYAKPCYPEGYHLRHSIKGVYVACIGVDFLPRTMPGSKE